MKPYQVYVTNEKIPAMVIWAKDARHAGSLVETCLQRSCHVIKEVTNLGDVEVLHQLTEGEIPEWGQGYDADQLVSKFGPPMGAVEGLQ